jgi:hypothetical protein
MKDGRILDIIALTPTGMETVNGIYRPQGAK